MAASAQNVLTPGLLWKIGRVSGKGISKDDKYVIYEVGVPDIAANKINKTTYSVPISGGPAVLVKNADALLADTKI